MKKDARGLVVALVAALSVLGWTGSAWATPDQGRNCSGCHANSYDAGTVTGNTGTLNPAGGSGSLKYYSVAPGGTVPLKFSITGNNGGDNVGVALLQLNTPALGNTHLLPYTPDPNWTSSGSGTSRYFYTPLATLSSTLGVRIFNLTVGSSAVPDIYTLRFNAAGGIENWNDYELFYLQVTPEPATMCVLAAGGAVLLRRRRGRC